MQSGWGVKNNLFGNYDPFIPNPTQYGGVYPRSHPVWRAERHGLRRNSNLSIQNGDYKEFAPRIGVAWSPRDKWAFRASYRNF